MLAVGGGLGEAGAGGAPAVGGVGAADVAAAASGGGGDLMASFQGEGGAAMMVPLAARRLPLVGARVEGVGPAVVVAVVAGRQ